MDSPKVPKMLVLLWGFSKGLRWMGLKMEPRLLGLLSTLKGLDVDGPAEGTEVVGPFVGAFRRA